MPRSFSKQHCSNTSQNRQLKKEAEDAAIQAHPSFQKLHGRWKKESELECAVHVGRLALMFKNTVIARNLQLDEKTIRNYREIDKLPSYWKSRIEHGNYVEVLKAARLDPHPDTPVTEQQSSTDSTIQSAPSTKPICAIGCAPASPGFTTAVTAAMPQPSTPVASNKAGLGQRQLRAVKPERPKTAEEMHLEHKREIRLAKIRNTASPVWREKYEKELLEIEHQLAALAETNAFEWQRSHGFATVADNFSGFFAARRAAVPSRKIKF